MWEMWEILCATYQLLWCVWLLCFVWNLNLLVFSSLLYLGLIYKISKFLHLQKNVQFLRFCTPNILKWPWMVCIDLYHRRLLSFIKILIKAHPTAAKCTYYVKKLDNFWWNLAKFHQMTWKSAADCLHPICLNGNFYYEQGWMGGNKWNFNYFPLKFNDFDQINIGGITFDLFYQIYDKFTS